MSINNAHETEPVMEVTTKGPDEGKGKGCDDSTGVTCCKARTLSAAERTHRLPLLLVHNLHCSIIIILTENMSVKRKKPLTTLYLAYALRGT